MKLKMFLSVLMASLCLLSAVSFADDDLKEAYREGYKTWKKTEIKGGFKGCSIGETLHFTNGLSFKCAEAEENEKGHHEVTILKHPKSGVHKVFIGDEELEGQLHGLK